MYCLQLPFIRVEEAVSWTHRFLTRNIWPKNRSLLMTNKFQSKCLQKFYFSSKSKKNATGRRHFTSRNRAAIFISTSRTTQQTFLAINLAGQQKTTKPYFSSQVRKQFKLFTVPLKPLCCCLQSDKLVNYNAWKFCKDLFLNFRLIWSVNQVVLFNGFLSDFVEITSWVYTKTIILFNLGE